MAGTSAVFIEANFPNASPVERDGMQWTAKELHLENLPKNIQVKPALQNVIALEGLEDYDPPISGDKRKVESLGVEFLYIEQIKGWVQAP